MKIIDSSSDLQKLVTHLKSQTQRICLVPTMGNLHDGHLALIKEGKNHSDIIIVSIFVNPLQFNNSDDLENYPRTLQQDIQKLSDMGVNVVFTPTPEMMYPEGIENHTYIEVPVISDILCGKDRPGHFRGVATIVAKLFMLVRPDIAIFGKKDFQQLMIIRKLVKDFSLNIEIIGLETYREQSGLAMSSRNNLLTEDEKLKASEIYRTMLRTKDKILKGDKNFSALEQEAKQNLKSCQFKIDYYEIRNRENLLPASVMDNKLIIFVAAYMGIPRLIDNLAVDIVP